MLDRQLYKFYISYRINGEVHLDWVEGINLRHAKERIEMKHDEASDLMDWTNERKEDLQAYLAKIEREKAKEALQNPIEKDNSTI